jgi:ABC-2 type transport system permease protein
VEIKEQAMTKFDSFVKKETLSILRDPRTTLIVLIIPVILVVLFGFAISMEINNLNVAAAAPHMTESIRRQMDKLDANQYFTFKGYVDASDIDETLRSGKVDAVVVFADDYDRQTGSDANSTAVQIVVDGSNTTKASAGAGYIQASILAGLGEDTASAGSMTGSVASLQPDIHVLFNPQMKSSYNFVPGVMGLIFILICAMMTSVSIVKEKETGTMEVLLVSPVKPMYIILSKMIPYFVLSCINLATILLLARYALGVPIGVSELPSIVAVSLLYLVLSLTMGLFISTVTTTQWAALVISGMLLLIPIMMFSGMLFPIENMPKVFQYFSLVVPARWYIDAMRKLMIEGVPFIRVLGDFLCLVAMTLVFLVGALKNFKDKLE